MKFPWNRKNHDSTGICLMPGESCTVSFRPSQATLLEVGLIALHPDVDLEELRQRYGLTQQELARAISAAVLHQTPREHVNICACGKQWTTQQDPTSDPLSTRMPIGAITMIVQVSDNAVYPLVFCSPEHARDYLIRVAGEQAKELGDIEPILDQSPPQTTP